MSTTAYTNGINTSDQVSVTTSQISAATTMAEQGHRDWLVGYIKDGECPPREKTIGESSFNIAVPWEHLHYVWKQKQIEIYLKYALAFDPSADIEEQAASVHTVWMSLNSWQVETSPQLFVPYPELSDEEKEKDRIVARLLSEHIK
jgi:hypothetical protein